MDVRSVLAMARRYVGAGIDLRRDVAGPTEVEVRSDPDEVARLYAATLLAEARDELNRADQKASILLAGAFVAVGAIVAGMISASWTPARLGSPWSELWITGAMVLMFGILALVYAIYPRTRRGRDDEPDLFYFRQAARITSVGDLETELRRSSAETFRRTADQLWRVSQVVGVKYGAVRVAIWLLGLGAGAMILSSSLSSVAG